jgi:hypothetical protein
MATLEHVSMAARMRSVEYAQRESVGTPSSANISSLRAPSAEASGDAACGEWWGDAGDDGDALHAAGRALYAAGDALHAAGRALYAAGDALYAAGHALRL